MKKLFMLFVVAVSGLACSELRSDKMESTSSDSASLKVNHMSEVIESYQLTGQGKKDWNFLFENFLTGCFYPVLEKNKLEQDCNICSDVYFTYTIAINSKGEIASLEKNNQAFECPGVDSKLKKQIEEEIHRYVSNLTFPVSLHNTTVKGRFGVVTKC